MKALNRLSITGLVALACLSSAQAGVTINRVDAGKMDALNAEASVKKSAIYIVQMRDTPVIAYQGGLAGFKGTKPANGGKIQKSSQSVQDYAAHLDAQHNRAISSVNANKVYSYRYGFNGFAARMTASDAANLEKRGDVLKVWKDELRQMQTDKSPKYIGVSQSGQAWARGMKGENVVIASIDSGIWPEHPSFANNKGSGPGNKRPWHGHLDISTSYNNLPQFKSSGCDFGNTAANPADVPASCSDKLLTARCYNSYFSSEDDPANPCGGNGIYAGDFEFQSARDYGGHGSHTAATAGGNNGVQASINGTELGLVSGIAPRARIAAYKVCWEGPDPTVTTDDGCGSADSAAAIDQAIADGVDVINYSVGGSSTNFGGPDNFAFLNAAAAGIFVATSNGNSGPDTQTVGTPAGVPWITAVGSTQDNGAFYSALDVTYPSEIARNYTAVEGNSGVTYAETGDMSGQLVLGNPLNGCTELTNPSEISGNIALIQRGACNFTVKYEMAAAAGARSIVVFNNNADYPFSMYADGATIPGQMISQADGELIAGFADLGTVIANVGPSYDVSAQNRVSGFSSRGPNGGAMSIIKPDISAPGTAILAAASPASGGEMFMVQNGTSMASPHVAGAFALLKQANPTWTPAMARSALMTTGRQGLMKTFGPEMATPFDIGAGEILPTTALYPGLAYDVGFLDYVAFTCGNNTPLVTPATCSGLVSGGFATDASELNLPSIAIANLTGTKTISRTVTSVALGYHWYAVTVDAPFGVDVTVSPESIWLGLGESATYEVTFTTNADSDYDWSFGSLTWRNSSGLKVRSPIAINPTQISTHSEVDSVADAEGNGSEELYVTFGYSGDFSADMSGLEAGTSVSDTLAGPGDSHGWCFDVPASVYTRIATYDVDTTTPGDDLDLDVYLGNSDCANSTTISPLGTSGGITSEEQLDIPNAPAGAYFVYVDYYSAAAGGVIDYTLWLQPVFGDNGNTTVISPTTAVSGERDSIMVDYTGLVQGRYLGVLHQNDADNEIGSTIIAVDATGSAPAPE